MNDPFSEEPRKTFKRRRMNFPRQSPTPTDASAVSAPSGSTPTSPSVAASARQDTPTISVSPTAIPTQGSSDASGASASGDSGQPTDASPTTPPTDGVGSGALPSPSSDPSSGSPSSPGSPSGTASSGSQSSSSNTSSSQPASSSSPTPSSASSAPPTSSSSTPPSTSSSPPSSSTPSSTSSPPASSSSAQSAFSASSSSSSLSPTPTPTPTPTPPPFPSGPSGEQTTVTIPVTTIINGTLVTSYEAVPTTLSDDNASSSSHTTTRAIVIGSVVGGVAFLVLALCLVLFYRRHQNKKLFFFGRRASRPRNMLLAGEDFDDYDLHPPMQHYSDYPASVTSHTAPSYEGSTLITPRSDRSMQARATPPAAASGPHLFPLRASESGSIFREAVWPPPSEASRLVDPLVAGSSQVDLGRIVDDVMGPHSTSSRGSRARPLVAHPAATFARSGREASYTSGESSPSAMHSRTTSHTALLQDHQQQEHQDNPESPIEAVPRPLFVTNMGPTSPDTTSPGSPPTPRNWLEREPRLPPREPTDEDNTFPMGEAM
ncbi:hypothetical protein CERSUDRAFT_119767 [Gelatoporia subvermispora B]|uniref:REJ domain-containing protein n=1 Tax=Ceriporiopsis subvermispora (strain B) TaxID=914234 RepID=M2QZJ6_CERS8|nr:hypothetical protein CERSUDRAFT_119767 [Gelatoporia subvermispora B]